MSNYTSLQTKSPIWWECLASFREIRNFGSFSIKTYCPKIDLERIKWPWVISKFCRFYGIFRLGLHEQDGTKDYLKLHLQRQGSMKIIHSMYHVLYCSQINQWTKAGSTNSIDIKFQAKNILEKQFFKYFFQFIVDNKMVYAT